ncbi:lipopolysaccharide biosynthesis protein [Qipengyuania sp. XHP0207]|uniref:lipopolysaccharide biosynthesis protein n=1 Tax=Qipengyuania sp. XHP0207 TaxID=3038078 RepID=UPI00241F2435|nr:lipopolysaccharide biosynthesis protein [Qipengyuania sp. XHP0207]MDG5746806.1 lipopolysaccharide biosynthesis protein [Qipengyuania sp. XHP0207]
MIWRSGSQIVGQLISWVSTFLVLRILDPADYGLYAMAAVVLTLLGLLNGYGLASALVQREEVSERDLRQLFGMLLVVNGALAAIQFLAAPFVASFYEQPQVADLLRVLALVLLTNPFLALGYAILARAMDFKKQAQVNLATSLLGAVVALAGALASWGVWTLVAAPISVFVTRAFAMMVAARAFMWPSFDFRGTGAMAGFGGAVALSSIFYFLQTQSDVVIAGRNFDAATVGLYTTALFLAQIFVNKIVPPLNEVAFTALSRMQADREALARGFLVSVRGIMLLAVPFCLGLAVTAEPLVHVLLGEKWLGTVPLLRTLGFAIPWMVLQVLFAPATNAVGRPGIALRNAALGALLMPLAFIVGVKWGIAGMAWAWLAAYPIIAIITAATSIRAIGVSASQLVAAVIPIALAGAAMSAIVSLADGALALEDSAARLAILVTVGAFVYSAWLFTFARDRLQEFLALVRNR